MKKCLTPFLILCSFAWLHETSSAENISAWFAPSTAKILRDAAPVPSPQQWSLAAAKNEVEACQLVLASDQLVKGVTVSVSALESASGKGSLKAELFKVEYVPVKKEQIPFPDPLPPLTGPFDLQPHQAQPVWISVRVPKDAAPGEYRGTVKAVAGEWKKEFPLSVLVWDFALPDAPACVTAFGIGYDHIAELHGVKPDSPEAKSLNRKYYEFVLDRRISPCDMPVDLMSKEAAAYLDDPRMTSYRIPYLAKDEDLKALVRHLIDGGRFAKGYFYVVDEPVNKAAYDEFTAVTDRLRRIESRYRIVAPFYSDPDFDKKLKTSDLMLGRLNIWCPHLDYLGREPGIREFLQGRKKAGESVWWYVCNNPREPYNNFHVDMGAMSHRTLPWQQKRECLQGLLYWDVNYWPTKVIKDPWENLDTLGTGYYGDGSLLYPGKRVGIDGPVSSLRLEVFRDGLEDYDYLALADRLLGPEVTKGHVAKIARSLTDYERDPAKLEEVRRELGVAIEKAQLRIAAPVQSAQGRRIAEPLVKPIFTPLPPGAIEPAGWLRDWALAARHGITGHLDEWSPVYRDAWKGVGEGAPGDGTGWPLEQSSYWLDGSLRLGYILHDDALIKKATDRLNLVVEGVNQGGESFMYWKKGPPEGFNSWACSHLGRALVTWYEASGDRRVLDALVKAYARFPVPREEIKFDDVTGLCNIDPMLETYAFSGDRRVFDQVMAAAKSPGVEATFRAWADRRYDPGHAVCAYEKLRLPILLYPWTGEQRYRDASDRALQWVDENHMLPFGVASGMENFAGIGAFRLTETCDVSADLWSSAWMYRIEGEGSFGDGIERAFFNAAPAPMARDFQTMCYYQSPNRIESASLPEEQPKAPGKGGLKFTRLGYPHVLCCVGACNRIIPNYVIHLWMATQDKGLAATLYGPCTVSAEVGDKVPVKLTCKTNYPFEETIHITVDPEQAATFPLYFRIPAWCGNARFAVNGSAQEATPDAKGFVRIERQWSKGDLVELVFPMSVRVAQGYETEYPSMYRQYFDYKPDEVFKKRRLPYESVSYGPLLFALPIEDKDPNTRVADARWQFALDVAPENVAAEAKIERRPMPAKWDWPLNGPIAITVPAKTFDWKPTDVQALPVEPVEGNVAEMIRLVPYGCTKFRISMFPVTKKAWEKHPRE